MFPLRDRKVAGAGAKVGWQVVIFCRLLLSGGRWKRYLRRCNLHNLTTLGKALCMWHPPVAPSPARQRMDYGNS